MEIFNPLIPYSSLSHFRFYFIFIVHKHHLFPGSIYKHLDDKISLSMTLNSLFVTDK